MPNIYYKDHLLWPPCVADADIIFLPCSLFFLLLLFFLAWSPPSQIGCLPYFHTWCGLRAGLRCRSEMCCTRFAENAGPKKSPKIRHLRTIAQLCWAVSLQLRHVSTTTTTTTVLRPFARDYPGEPVPEETLTHPPSWSSNLYQLLTSTTIHSILVVQITCLAIFLHNLSPCPLWSTSWSGVLHLIFHTFLHPISVFFSQHMPIPSQPVLM